MRGHVRLAVWCLVVVLVALPIVGVLNGWFAAGSWPVRRLTVQASFKHVDAQQIRTLVQPYLSRGFFALDLGDVQKAVAAVPWVASVEASKRWPDTLLLRVHERHPFARWNERQLISRQGVRFSVPDVPGYAGLPDLRGPDDQMSDVVGFYAQALKAFAGTGVKIAAVTLTDRGSWTLGTADGAQIVLGDRTLASARLRRFIAAYPQVVAGHADHFVYADLRYTNGFAVRWPPPAAGANNAAART
jgi:cell division protein FtsQ